MLLADIVGRSDRFRLALPFCSSAFNDGFPAKTRRPSLTESCLAPRRSAPIGLVLNQFQAWADCSS